MVAEPNGVTHSRKIEIQVDQSILVDLNPPAVLAGTVIDRATRQPLADVILTAIVVDAEAELAPGAEEGLDSCRLHPEQRRRRVPS